MYDLGPQATFESPARSRLSRAFLEHPRHASRHRRERGGLWTVESTKSVLFALQWMVWLNLERRGCGETASSA